MKKNFEASLFNISKKEISNSKTVFYFGCFIAFTPLIIKYIYLTQFNTEIDGSIFTSATVLGFVIMICANIYQFSDYERIKSEKNGYIEFSEDEIIISFKERIKYSELTDFKIIIDAYYNQTINPSFGIIADGMKSLGISNSLEITHNLKSRTFNFKLENESHKDILERTIYQLVINDKLKNLDGKEVIYLIPEKFRQTIEYKEYIIRQLKARKVSCAEGLLMIGYKNYEEAQELKKKYCS